jgi:uncharacterized protein (TIGR03546 family)
MLKMLANLLKLLNSEADPCQISFAFAFSMVAGLTPFLSLHNILVLFIVLILRVNLSAFILGLLLFSGLAYLLDPLFHWVGLTLLTAAPLEGLWSMLYSSPIFRLERFNNSIVLGSLLFSLVFFIPLHLVTIAAINKYREHVLGWVQKSRLMQILKANKFYNIYLSLTG